MIKRLLSLLFILLPLVACSEIRSIISDTEIPQSSTMPALTTQDVENASDTVRATAILQTAATLDREFEDRPEMQQQREQLVASFVEPAVEDESVIAALRAVPRHSFIPTENLDLAYNDHPLPIGYGQTISQPSLVAMMTELLELEADDKVLEIGTGSGYQAAILGEITREVYSVEIIPELANSARAILDRLGYDYVQLDRQDGYFGWQEHAPFDAIIVTAAPDHLPQPLVQQLSSDGGRMIIPIGPVGNVQTLWLVTRNGEDIQMERIIPVRFVPFTREGE